MPSPVDFDPVPFMRWLVVAFGLVCAVSNWKCARLQSFPVVRDKPSQLLYREWGTNQGNGNDPNCWRRNLL